MIEVSGLVKKYRSTVLDSVNYVFPSSSVTFVMGANGAGKTSLFKCILGLEGYEGKVSFDGQGLSSVRDQIVSVFDDTPFYPHLSGRRNLEILVGERIPVRRASDVMGGYDAEPLLARPVKSYSSGQRKRLAIAYAGLVEPKYLLLDEVASGLDLDSMDAVVSGIKELALSATIVVSGHQFDFYSRVIDHVALLSAGKLETVDIDDTSANSLESTYRELVAQGSH